MEKKSQAQQDLMETALISDGGSHAEPDVKHPSSPASESPSPGSESFGRYELKKVLGEGAMGAVYLARDTQLNRDVALKVPKFDQKITQLIERFYREARAAATLTHPNICPVYDVGEHEGKHYITMAFVQGQPLSKYVGSGPQPPRKAAGVIRKLAGALHEAHRHNVVHRDLKPANIMIDQRGEPIVMDFGLARHIDQAEDSRLTREGAIVGSPAYMSPEQIEGKPDKIGPGCDIFSLGVVMYELLTGKLPFQGEGSMVSLIAEILTKDPDPVSSHQANVDPRLEAICMKAMAKDVADRYTSMEEMSNAIRKVLQARPPTTGGGNPQATVLNDQVDLVRTLCKKGQFEAAEQILQSMSGITDPELQEFTTWAQQELANVRESARQSAITADPLTDSLTGPLADLSEFDPLMTAAATAPLMPAPKAVPQPSMNKPVWIAGGGLAVGLLVVLTLVFGGSDDVANEGNVSVALEEPANRQPGVRQPGDEPHPNDVFDSPDNERPPGPPSDRLPFRHPQEAIDLLDRNDDGLLSTEELGPSLERVADFDEDRDGFLSLDEIRVAVRSFAGGKVKRELADRLFEHDRNQDDEITRDELPAPLQPLFAPLDRNRDGVVDRAEFESRRDLLEKGPRRRRDEGPGRRFRGGDSP